MSTPNSIRTRTSGAFPLARVYSNSRMASENLSVDVFRWMFQLRILRVVAGFLPLICWFGGRTSFTIVALVSVPFISFRWQRCDFRRW